MDKRIEWPWSSEEEAEWKTELAERDEESVEELMGDTIEDAISGPPEDVNVAGEASTEESLPEKYSVTT